MCMYTATGFRPLDHADRAGCSQLCRRPPSCPAALVLAHSIREQRVAVSSYAGLLLSGDGGRQRLPGRGKSSLLLAGRLLTALLFVYVGVTQASGNGSGRACYVRTALSGVVVCFKRQHAAASEEQLVAKQLCTALCNVPEPPIPATTPPPRLHTWCSCSACWPVTSSWPPMCRTPSYLSRMAMTTTSWWAADGWAYQRAVACEPA